MPQVFQVLRCYQCEVFQVHQAKKSNKWACKVCGEKQSVKRRYGVGSAKDCRFHVQKLNGIRGEQEDVKNLIDSDTDDDTENFSVEINCNPSKQESKWSEFIDKQKPNKPDAIETMYVDNTEVVLEVPKKRKRTFKCPTLKTYDSDNIQDEDTGCMNIVKSSVFEHTTFKTEAQILNNIPSSKNNKMKQSIELQHASSSSSKWAQFITENNSDTNLADEYDDVPPTGNDVLVLENSKNSQGNLFSLCDDQDLDSILDI